MKKSFFRWLLVIPVLAAALLACDDDNEETNDKPVSQYLTFVSEGTTTLSLSNEGGNAPVLYYSTDGTAWTKWNYAAVTFTKNSPLYLYGDNPAGFSKSSSQYSTFAATGDNFGVGGNIMSLISTTETLTAIPCPYCFYSLFKGCENLITAPALPAVTLTESCYSGMFQGCKNLRVAPELPAVKLTKDCYFQMFYHCDKLTAAPELPATTLAYRCYGGMFRCCYGLTAAPALPATTLVESCYFFMFDNCVSLTAAPELPAATLARQCYESMFTGCTKLSYIKCLATDIHEYNSLHNWVLNVASSGTFIKASAIDVLPSGSAVPQGWEGWTQGGSGIPEGWLVQNDGPVSNYLTFISEGTTTLSLSNEGGNAPVLYYSRDAVNWTRWDYSAITFTSGSPLYMYGDNPDGIGSYYIDNFSELLKYSTFVASSNGSSGGGKFRVEGDIMSLLSGEKKVTAIPAMYCFYRLFKDCDLLTAAPDLTAASLPMDSYAEMFSGCTNLGYVRCLATTLYHDSTADWMSNTSATGTFVKAGGATWPRGVSGIPEGWTVLNEGPVSQYLTFKSEGSTTLSLYKAGDNAPVLYYSRDAVNWTAWDYSGLAFTSGSPLYLYGDNPEGFSKSEEQYSVFQADGDNFGVEGSVMSLISGYETLTVIPNAYCFYHLFNSCKRLTVAPELPATTLTEGCYSGMFYHTGLTTAPALPATTLATSCYLKMFWFCTSLKTAPALPATTLAPGCYSGMFSTCASLEAAPALPATTLALSCYSSMFSSCTSLKAAPVLPATTLATSCYSSMFRDCTGLTVAPVLPATTLAPDCYAGMFDGCYNLNYVKCLATDISAPSCLYGWMDRTASSGTFVKAAGMDVLPSGSAVPDDWSGWTRGRYGIPEGWTVQNAQ